MALPPFDDSDHAPDQELSDAYARMLSDYHYDMMRRSQNPDDQLFRIYDRMTSDLENDRPGAERAHGETQGHLRNYYMMRARHNALTRGR